MLRGHIVKLKGVPAEEAEVSADTRWVISGDRGVTYASTPPEDTRVVEGPAWWPADYRGPQLVSFDAALAAALGLGLGDTVTVNVLGRDIEATIASLRRIEWTTLSINFVFVFSPGTLDKAPHTFLATVKATPQAEDAIFDTITERFPNVTVVRIRDAIATAADVLANIGFASRVIGFLRRHHATHHTPELMQKWNFNVTVPLADHVLRTVWRDAQGAAAARERVSA